MFHRLSRLVTACATVYLVAACADQQLPSNTRTTDSPQFAISDAAHGGTPEFSWLPPTVASTPGTAGTFDADALHELTIEICRLNDTACSGGTILSIDATTLPASSRLRLSGAGEFYEATWLTGPSGVKAGESYRVSVLRNDVLLGFIDVMMVRNTPEARAVDRSRYAAIVKGQQFPIRFRLDQPSTANSLRINEVESNQGIPGDWVEFHNSANVPFDLAGYVFMDNADDHIYVIPAGTMIPAHGFLVLDEADDGTPGFDFGLGATESARLFAPDGTTLIDSYSWAGGHAATTYGRCPDGNGDFQLTSIVTKGGANDCAPLITINEIESSGGTPGDWIELYNANAVPVDISGHIVKDDDDSHSYAIPAGTVIAANGFLVIEAEALGFGLGQPDAVRLFRPDGVAVVDSYAWATHATTSYGRCPDGAGSLAPTASPTKGTANICGVPVTGVVFNEVESNGDPLGDWAELYNTGDAPADVSGYIFRDNDDSKTFVLPAGSVIPAHGHLLIPQENLAAPGFTFGLGGNDMVRLFSPSGGTLVASHAWSSHAVTTYGRCPDGSGAFVITNGGTRGTANDCGLAVRLNEIESNGDAVGDWVELYNNGGQAADLTGFVLRDNNDASNYVLPAGSVIAAGGYLVLDVAQFAFGLGGTDAVRLFHTDGTTLVDSHTWAAHAATTYGRCPNGTGAFATTQASTKGALNSCPGDLVVGPWPGDAVAVTADGGFGFGGDMSGLTYAASGSAAPGTLWASQNSGAIWKLVWDGANWAPDAAWGGGKTLRFPGGTGTPDAEGVTLVGDALYVASERNDDVSGVSRLSILRYDANAIGAEMIATHEWNVTANLPVVGSNLGLEAITWIPDSYLTARGFVDESIGQAYDPANYPDHNGGIFFVGVEANGMVHGFALDHVSGAFTRVATIASGYTGIMALEFDAELGQFWAVCDNGCNGRSVILAIDQAAGSSTLGQFIGTLRFERPAGLPNNNNEGFAIAAQAECSANRKPAFWSNDDETGGFAIWRGTTSCTGF